MRAWQTIQNWLDIRPAEARPAGLSVLGAFLIMAFLILGRSLREAFYLTSFPVDSLPYITAAVAFLSLPVVSAFTSLLGRISPRRVLTALTVLVAAGLLPLWPFAAQKPAAVVLFYLWTALGTLLLTSGFWVVTSEYFALRGAKRLFGIIAAGGTAGALLMGASLPWLTSHLALTSLLAGLVLLLVLFWLVQVLLPPRPLTSRAAAPPAATNLRYKLKVIGHDPHLRTLAALVFTATCASTLLDYQFKELARASAAEQKDLAGFLGAFYGWTGGLALLVQLLFASRLIAAAGIAGGLALLPLLLLLGSGAFLAAGGLVLATMVRGADNALRRSLFRPLLEYLYVPLPAAVRRSTKTVIDTVVDSGAEGCGALLIFCWVTLPGLPSRYLSVLVILLAVLLLWLSRRMGQRYFQTISERLEEGASDSEAVLARDHPQEKDLLSAVFTRMDLHTLGEMTGVAPRAAGETATVEPGSARAGDPADEADTLALLHSPSDQAVVDGLARVRNWDGEHLSALTRLLARDALHGQVVRCLVAAGPAAVPRLAAALCDESTDFLIRRRIPAVMLQIDDAGVEPALLGALRAGRFEVRYRAAMALVRRQRSGRAMLTGGWRDEVWQAVGMEVKRERPVWELQKLLDRMDTLEDEMVVRHVDVRGALSLEHTFRMLSLVLDAQLVRAAFQGIILPDANLKGYALEYLEQALPAEIRKRLWLFIGDVSEHRRRRSLRSLDQIADDLMTSRATLFAGQDERQALRRMLDQERNGHS